MAANPDLRAESANNFNLLRLIASSLVIVSHGIELPSGVAQRDFMHGLTGFTLSWYAVSIFFVISGYLIVESWIRRPDPVVFALSRCLRIMPGLVVMLIVSVPLLGLLFGTLSFSRFLSDPATRGYFLANVSIVITRYDLPGVFTGNPLPAVNGSLWTLKYELLCYVMVGFLGTVGLLAIKARRLTILLAGCVVSIGLMLAVSTDLIPRTGRSVLLFELGRLTFSFLLGALYRDLRDRIPLNALLLALLWLAILPLARTQIAVIVACLASAYTAMYFAFIPQQAWLSAFRGNRDYSYGVYIYAFPIQQALVALMPGAGAAVNIVLSFIVTFPFAILSWHLVEKPALGLKRRFRPATQPVG